MPRIADSAGFGSMIRTKIFWYLLLNVIYNKSGHENQRIRCLGKNLNKSVIKTFERE